MVYTVISIREDSTYEPRCDYVEAQTPDDAERLAKRANWVVVAILRKRHELQ